MRLSLAIFAVLSLVAVSAVADDRASVLQDLKDEQRQMGKGAEKVTVRDLELGKGTQVVDGARVVVQYVGWLKDGTKFDSSYDRGRPFDFTLGQGEVIRGWELGIRGMQVGGRREITIPPNLAYGEKGAGTLIAPNATLKFEIELLKVEAPTFTLVDPDLLKTALSAGVKIVDVRPPARVAETGSIAGSINITAFTKTGKLNRKFMVNLLKHASKDEVIVLIDDDGRHASFLGSFLSQNAHFENLQALKGGLKAWSDKGYQLQ